MTTQMQRLEAKIRATSATLDEASHAVEVLSDNWVNSSAAEWGKKAGLKVASIRVCSVPKTEREKRANAAKTAIKRLQSVLRRTRNAQFEVSVKALKLLGSCAHVQWLSECRRTVTTPTVTDGERFLFPTEAK